MRHKFFHPDSKQNIIIKYIAERKWDELCKRKDEIEKENSRYTELQNTRIRHAQGLELDRAKGGVSFIYDEPPTFERWQEKREKKLREIEGLYRYEWQKTAPRHDFVDENLPAEVAASTNLHNPFGVRVESVKVACFRCGQHGHLYSDRHCPMFDKPLTDEEKRKRGKQIFTIEVEPERLDRLVDDFNKTYNEYHSVTNHSRLGYRSKQVRLNKSVVNELRLSSDIDPAGSYKDEDEEYVQKLDPVQRDILFKVIRRMIREKRRRHRIDQMKKGESINTGAISDDSDEEGEFQFSTAVIEDNFTSALDEMVFGKPAPPKQKTKNDLLPSNLTNDIAESLKRILLSDDLEPLENAVKTRLTQRHARAQVRAKNEALERADPLADAVMVFVGEGKTQTEIESNLEKLEREKKTAIEIRMRMKRDKHEAEIRRLEEEAEQRLRDVENRLGNYEDESKPAPETVELRKLKEKRQDGLVAIEKIKTIKERLLEVDQRILQEEQERKMAKIKKVELQSSRSTQEQELRERLERRKKEQEKEKRRKEREEKRRLRKMNKKLEKLKEREDCEKLAHSDLGELALVTKRSKTESGSKIQVLTKHQRTKKEPTGDELEEGEIQTNQRPDQSVHFETIVKGKKQKIDADFLNKFGINLD